MKTPVITFMVKKGGTGKTTTAFLSAVGLSKRGHRVLLIDADQQGSSVLWSKTSAKAGVQHIPTCVPASRAMLMQRALEQKDELYDYVIIDTASNYDESYASMIGTAISESDCTVLPLKPGDMEYSALLQTVEVLQARWEAVNAEVPRPRVLRNLWNYTNAAKRINADLEATGLPLFRTRIYERVDFSQGVFDGVTALHSDEYRKVFGHPPSPKCTSEAESFLDELELWINQEPAHAV